MAGTQSALFYGVSATLLVVLTGLCFFEINSLWLFGHDGFNSASYAHAAQMILERDTWALIKYDYGPGELDAHDIYTRHPYLLSYFVAALYWLTGHSDSELLARLVPIVFSILSGVAVWATLLRFWGRSAALFGTCVLLLCPVFTIYATMLDHEQGCFFFSVSFLAFYVSWLKEASRTKLIAILMLVTLAAQYDWTAYYMALPVALHAVAYGFWKAERKLSWRGEYTFAIVFSVVVLANIGGFLYAMGQLAGFDELRAGLSGRSEWPDGYLSQLWKDVDKMFTYPVFWLGAAWLLRMLQRWVTGNGRLRDFIPLVFLWGQLFRSLYFSQAGQFHIYWVYYGAGFFAFAGADLLDELVRRFPAWLEHRTPRRPAVAQPALAVMAVLAVGYLGWAAVDGFPTYMEGHEKGGAVRLPYRSSFNHSVQRFHKIGQLRPAGLLLIDDSAWRWDPQFRWYLGYPHLKHKKDGRVPSSRAGEAVTSVVFDMRKGRSERWLPLMSRHHVTVLNGRLAIIDLTDAERRVDALRSRPAEASVWHRYWTNFFLPPLRWGEDRATKARIRRLYAEHVDDE